ncbi:MAG: hypothetical protein COB90_04735 [Hyphomicrobiales bacterium]|nr:MAG: hypothetical protein COB90_04735 [Hyphomicrobiales bacterium]
MSEADRQRLNSGQGCPGCELSNANLRSMQLQNQNLSGANLTDANLNNASLYNTNLSGANLTNANLRNSNPGNANFTGANLTGADFTGVHELDMQGAVFTDAIICNTKWIDGSTIDICP